MSRDRVGEHAIVIGASMTGLLAARALSEAYERVTVLERDSLPPLGRTRRAVPQGRHIHVLMPGGLAAIEELLPGFGDELEAAGAPRWQASREVRFAPTGEELVRAPFDIHSIAASRPFLEGHVLRRVHEIDNVIVRERCSVTDLLADGDGRVAGVRLAPAAGADREHAGGEAFLRADLVVAATGRSNQVGAWLTALGYEPPGEERLDVDVRYASRELRLRAGALRGDKLVFFPARPGQPRTFGLFALEGGRHMLTVAGYGDDSPPSDYGELLAFAATVAPPDVMRAIRDAEPLGKVATFRFPANVRRRYERLRRFPEGLLVTGDAVCSFNPVYGQGMSVAALEAEALRACLQKGGARLGHRFRRAVAKVVDPAWQLAVGADLALPEVEGHRPLAVRILNAYIARVQAAGVHDAKVAEAFLRVLTMVELPPHVLQPGIALRVLLAGRRDRRWVPVRPIASSTRAPLGARSGWRRDESARGEMGAAVRERLAPVNTQDPSAGATTAESLKQREEIH